MKYFIAFLATVGLIVLVFILVIRGFSGTKAPKDRLVLADHVTSSMAVQLTVDGEVTADQTHVGYRIYVDRNLAKIEIYKGYQNTVTDSKTYANNDKAYAQFLRALDFAGFAKGDDDAANADDRGVCASGSRYIYQIDDTPEGDKRYWSTTCGGGTFKGDTQEVRQLFQRQIPEFSKLTSSLGI
jgi:hypothetical protein